MAGIFVRHPSTEEVASRMHSPHVRKIIKRLFGAAFAAIIISSRPDAARAERVARYTFDDSTANDSSGHGNNGTLLGNAAIVTDPVRGKVLSLTGSGGKVDLGNPAGLNVIGDFTAAAWVNSAVVAANSALGRHSPARSPIRSES